MRHGPAGAIWSATLAGAALAGVLAVAVGIPAAWLKWEAEAGHAQAVVLAEAASARVQDGLQDLLARFDRATEGVRAQDLAGDPVGLTARLLRAEALVAPVDGVVAINANGQQLASSAVAASPRGPVWWVQPARSATRRAGVVGCGVAAPEGEGWMLARRIEGGQNVAAGFIGGFLPAAALRALAAPDGLDAILADADGCRLLTGAAAPAGAVGQPLLARLYRAVLPARWTRPEPVVVTGTAGNLVWTGTIGPEAALALRSGAIAGHAGFVLALAGALVVLVLAGGLGMALRPRGGGEAAVRSTLADMAGERDRVLAAIGHDVRTPINSILGICALLLDGERDAGQRKWLQRIRASCQALMAMLNGMLEIAAAGLDGTGINPEAVDVAGLVEEAGEVLRPQAEDKGLELHVVIDESVSGTWSTDPTRLRQVLFNLCGNAVKYTARGSVELGATVVADGGRQRLRLRVADTGPGIAEDEREVIFEQFRRGRDEVSGGREGLGLGLALCREIAGRLGGSLSLESTLGQGSVFTFEIPIERAAASLVRVGPLAGRSALVVGLSEGMRRRVASHLAGIGFLVETGADGFLALGLAERIIFNNGTLDLMVIDAALTGLSAEALIVRLQAGHPHQRLRTVLVANGPLVDTAEDRADAVVPHPVEAADLDRLVAGFFGDRSILQEVDPGAPAAPRSRVLVVEDNRTSQALLVDQLTRAGFSAVPASDGREAVEAFQRGGFDAILMDVQMPELDGLEATRRIRAGETAPERVPIVGLTAHTGAAMRKRCLEAGMDMVLHKPVDFSALPLRLREAIAGAGAAGPAVPAGERAPAPMPSLDVDDEYVAVLVSEIGADRAAICIGTFLADTVAHLAKMDRLLDDARWEELGPLAHGLAGISGTLGAMTLADGLLQLEDAARAGEGLTIEAALAEVHATWERTRVALRARQAALSGDRSGSSKRAA